MSKTIEELAIDAFEKQEVVNIEMMMNMPTDYQEREKAFVRLAVARAALNKAQAELEAATKYQKKQ
jgi:hypothetical protein